MQVKTMFVMPVVLSVILSLAVVSGLEAQEQPPGTLEQQLRAEGEAALARAARKFGDPKRGALTFHQAALSCVRCHALAPEARRVGPNLTEPREGATDEYLVQSLLDPSRVIRKGFETTTVVTDDGRVTSGLVVSESDQELVLADLTRIGEQIRIDKQSIDERATIKRSAMPDGIVNLLADRQQFLDLARYVMEISNGGRQRASELQPPAELYAEKPIPEYENHINHESLIAGLDDASFQRGKAIYERVCSNCHGTHDRPGSLPTSLRFATGKFKNGSDPLSMYRTLTHGYGMMVRQSWMVPKQKYDVIHYIREAYLKESNPDQYVALDRSYLDRLPSGDQLGPEPLVIEPWVTMDYGAQLTASYEFGEDGSNIAYKGIAMRLDSGAGGVSRGQYWSIFDHDTMRMAGGWTGRGFIDWNGIMFNGRHGIHPRVVGKTVFANPTGPGWADPETGSFADPRLRGRDEKPYGPLPRSWAQYKGLYHYGDRTIISYTVGTTSILEMPGVSLSDSEPVYLRTFNFGPRPRALTMQVSRVDGGPGRLGELSGERPGVVILPAADEQSTDRKFAFDGRSYVEVAPGKASRALAGDFSVTARVRTRAGGTVLAVTQPGDRWVPDGKALFIRGGRLTFDIGWVGAVTGRTAIADGQWHDVGLVWRKRDGRVQLFVDGKLDGSGQLSPKQSHDNEVLRLGFAAPNFPRPATFLEGQLDEVRLYDRELTNDEIQAGLGAPPSVAPLAQWNLNSIEGDVVSDHQNPGNAGRVVQTGAATDSPRALAAGVLPAVADLNWTLSAEGDLRLTIPAGEQPLRMTVWLAAADDRQQLQASVEQLDLAGKDLDLSTLTAGGPRRWTSELKTEARIGESDGPFAVDTLLHPEQNPWSCRVRLTGFDFLAGADRMAVCSWDGDVWLVSGVARPEQGMVWKRIASGLFQPLGVKVINGQIFVTCRDQIVILRDLNGDEETDFYECFNNDHQVTEHFHEFAMGLQVDAAGNLYYAKSARHALPALVPHHGTLLRVTPDGAKTEIVASGFRAANGVCLNADGTFIVTDQEGHWNPKNRINWVREGGFYGNMFGYHDVTDSSDSAMEQPLCWITNSFDRSPAELLWVRDSKWGPLEGSLLNLSYGYGKVYIVPHEEIDGQTQGGMCELPIPQFPTGVMRGRFHPDNGQLYTCGMFAWAGNQQAPGGFYRVRATGRPVHLPVGLNARQAGMQIRFSGKLDPVSAQDPGRYAVRVWDLKRTANYGSKHYNERELVVESVQLAADGQTVLLEIPEIGPTWCMEIRYSIRGAGNEPVDGVIHNTIHQLGP